MKVNNQKIYKDKDVINKTNYDKISKKVSNWPQWKKDLCNQELIISVGSKKI